MVEKKKKIKKFSEYSEKQFSSLNEANQREIIISEISNYKEDDWKHEYLKDTVLLRFDRGFYKGGMKKLLYKDMQGKEFETSKKIEEKKPSKVNKIKLAKENVKKLSTEDLKINLLQQQLDDLNRKSKNKEMKEFISGIISLGIFGWVGWSVYTAFNPKEEIIESFEIVRNYDSPNSIFQELKKNRYTFDNEINGKFISVKGYLDYDSIKKNYFSIEGSGVYIPPRVSCYPNKSDLYKLGELKSGQTLKITGIVNHSDILGDSISLKRCLFTTNVNQEGSKELFDIMLGK